MKRLSSHTIGVDSGEVVLFSDYEDGGEMWTGRGQRERRRHIKFSEPYNKPPAVQLSISMWDVDTSTTIRSDLNAESITKTGFDMVFRTWGDTRIARIRIAWSSIGEMPDDDAWELY